MGLAVYTFQPSMTLLHLLIHLSTGEWIDVKLCWCQGMVHRSGVDGVGCSLGDPKGAGSLAVVALPKEWPWRRVHARPPTQVQTHATPCLQPSPPPRGPSPAE